MKDRNALDDYLDSSSIAVTALEKLPPGLIADQSLYSFRPGRTGTAIGTQAGGSVIDSIRAGTARSGTSLVYDSEGRTMTKAELHAIEEKALSNIDSMARTCLLILGAIIELACDVVRVIEVDQEHMKDSNGPPR